MSELRINNITDTAGSSGPIIAGVSTVTSTSHMVMPSGPTEMRGGRGRAIVFVGATPSATTLIDAFNTTTAGDAFDFGDASAANPLNYAVAAGAGVADFAVDTVNIIPGVNIPKLPTYESGVLQGVREISGIVIPSLYGGMWLKGLGKAAHLKVGWAVGNNPLMKFMGNAGADALAGGIVDRINTVNESDHNAAGSLKAAWPQTYGWIPDNIATLDSDSPEVKRMKNVNEGIGLSFFGDIMLGLSLIHI